MFLEMEMFCQLVKKNIFFSYLSKWLKMLMQFGKMIKIFCKRGLVYDGYRNCKKK